MDDYEQRIEALHLAPWEPTKKGGLKAIAYMPNRFEGYGTYTIIANRIGAGRIKILRYEPGGTWAPCEKTFADLQEAHEYAEEWLKQYLRDGLLK